MIDTHAHLDFEQFDEDREGVINRFFNDGGKAIVNIGVDFKRNEKSLKIASENSKIFSSLGFHPEEGSEKEIDLVKIENYLREKSKNSKVVAIGEIGLDYFHTKDEKKQEFQRKLFIKQLEIARDLNLPVIIHCRDAYEDLLEIISQEKFREMKMVVHCFCGGVGELDKFLQLPNLKISFTGNITFVKDDDKLTEVVKKIPIDRIMVETDCPFLAPVPNRGKRNEPVYVKYVIEKIAEIKGLNFKEIEKQTDKNAIEFFDL
jgi:TatD DNase family protein